MNDIILKKRGDHMEKVIIFTHGIDIDGFGCAILGKLAYPNAVIIFADNFDIDEKIKSFKNLEAFDKIYITDHCPSLELCKNIEGNENLLSKTKILDHHASRINEQGALSWIDIISEDESGKKCGTSLFYEHLVGIKKLQKTKALDDFVELTRLYDVWDWINDSQNGIRSYRLNTLFQAVGRDKYIEKMLNRLKEDQLGLSDEDENLVDEYILDFNNQLQQYTQSIKVIDFAGNRVGFVEIMDLFKNDVAKEVRRINNPDNLDYLLMPLLDRNSVSLRNVKPDFDVSKVAKELGGGGHSAAASFPKENLPNEIKQLINKDITK